MKLVNLFGLFLMTDNDRNIIETIFEWLIINNIGDIASIIGLFIVIVGFGFTLWNVSRSKRAATRAEQAANEARQSIRTFDTVSDFAAGISTMDEIKRLHREGAWSILPDRYSDLRKRLVALRSANPGLRDDQKKAIQSAITHLAQVEQKIEVAIQDKEPPKDIAKLNTAMSKKIDDLHEILVEIKSNIGV